MRYLTGSQPEPQLEALVNAAQDEPVFIDRGQREVAVPVSPREYDRLNSAANLKFQIFCDEISEEAAASGLTEATLNSLLHDA